MNERACTRGLCVGPADVETGVECSEQATDTLAAAGGHCGASHGDEKHPRIPGEN